MKNQKGIALIVVLLFMSILFVLAIGAIQLTSLNTEMAGAHKKGKQALYASEVGLDVAINNIILEFEDLAIYTTTADNGGTPSLTISNYRGHDVTYNVTNPLDRYMYRTVVGNSIMVHFAYTYDIESEAASLTDNATEHVEETIRILETPLVQYFAFYGGTGDLADLELYPGADMNLWGRMHSNRDMYIVGRGSDIVLRNWDTGGNFAPHFMAMGRDFRGDQKHNVSTWASTDTFVRTNSNLTVIGNPPTDAEFLEIPLLIDSSNEAIQEPLFNDYLHVNSKTHQAPGKNQFERLGFYEDRSEDPQNPRIDTMKIIGDGSGIRVWVSRPTYTEVTNEIINGGTALFHSDGSAMFNNPIEDNTGTSILYDGREGRWVDFTDVDLNRVGEWYQDYLTAEGLSWAGDGMLIYASRSDTSTIPNPNNGARLDAFRLKTQFGSFAELSANTTFATDNPIYVQGDFNILNPKGVALVADAMNILSNAFTTKGTSNVGGNYVASTTTVNAAFFSGIIPNVEDSGSRVGGGLHNYARLHESWGNSNTLNITGSFISLWESTQASGTWCHGNGTQCYYRPSRNYGWDVRFQDPSFWPPFIPSIFSVERVGFLEG